MLKNKVKFDLSASALSKWNPKLVAARAPDNALVMDIYSEIGEGWDGRGFTAKLAASILRGAEGKDITVNINSPGGDFFEGLAINTLLAEYEGEVTVNVVGIAASAASVIALGGDTVNIAENGFLMIHNAWSIVLGNKNDLRETADVLSRFDISMAKLYASKTGIALAEVEKLMDAETWIDGAAAVEKGFADALLAPNASLVDDSKDTGYNSALRKVDCALASAGMPRSERRHLIKELTGKPSAAEDESTKPGASDVELSNALSALLSTIRT